MQDKPRLGEILVAAGVIDEIQLVAALGEQGRWGSRLGSTLIKMGLLEEGQLIRALAKQLELPVASLAGKRIAEEVIALVPARVATKHGVIPLFTRDEGAKSQLFLGMEDPADLSVLDDLSFRTGMEIRPVMVSPSELGEAIDRYYHGRSGAVYQVDPFRAGETFGNESKRSGTRPSKFEEPTELELEASEDERLASRGAQIELADVGLEDAPTSEEIKHALEEAEKSRVVAEVLAQLLIEKGVLTNEELESRIEQLRSV